jgi:cytoskeletal protein CcmA (bactofilin family)
MNGDQAAKTVIAEDVEIVGSVKSTGDIHLSGKLSGDLTCNGNATIGQSANIKGNISADSTTISGQVNGNVSAKDRIEMKATARVNGDIRAKRLTVEDGVTFVGKSEVNPSGSAPRSSGDGKGSQDAPAQAEPAAPAEKDDKGKAGMFNRK